MVSHLLRSFILSFIMIFVSAQGALAVPENAGKNEKGYYVQGRILVQPAAGASDQQVSGALAAHDAIAERRIHGMQTMIARVPEGREEQILNALTNNPFIEYAELDYYLPPSLVPDDPDFSSQWHHARIGSSAAWDVSVGDQSIIIAILDTGVNDAHVDLAANMVPGWNSASNTSDSSDIHGHGTKVAGAAAAIGNNGIGVAGVAMNVRIMPIRMTDRTDGWATSSAAASGLNWARQNGARVANISYAFHKYSTTISAAAAFNDAGGVVCNSAGNDNADDGSADAASMITLAATTSSDGKASWSNFGQFVDLAAPGVSIRTTTKGGGYGNVSGTSFASPVTCGVAALILSANPGLSAQDVEDILETTAVDLGDAGYDVIFGHGRVNAGAALALAQNYTPTQRDDIAPTVSITSPAAQQTVAGAVSVDVNAFDNIGVTRVDLFVNGAFYASDSAEPYSFAWDTAPLGNADVNLVAKAWDAEGNEGTSSSVPVLVRNIVDTTPPVVSISSPADGEVLSSRSATITASATDNMSVSQMTLFIDGAQRTTVTGSSLSYNWNLRKVADGAHTIKIEATDSSGNVGSRIIQVSKGGGTSGGGGKGGGGGGGGKGKNK
jgi:subtilisin family serine protease